MSDAEKLVASTTTEVVRNPSSNTETQPSGTNESSKGSKTNEHVPSAEPKSEDPGNTAGVPLEGSGETGAVGGGSP